MGTTHPLILVENLFKSYGHGSKRVEVLKGISLTFCPGEAVAIYGSSGVGKSTFMHILGTLDRPTSGRVIYRGQDIFSMEEKALAEFRNREVGFIFQFYHLLPEFNALENWSSKSRTAPARRSSWRLASGTESPISRGNSPEVSNRGWLQPAPSYCNLLCCWPMNPRET